MYKMPRHSKCLSIVNSNVDSLFSMGTIVGFDKDSDKYYPVINENIRKAFVYGVSNAAECHPDDPLLDLKFTLDEDIAPLVNDYRRRFSLEELKSPADWIIMKYEKGCFFNNHKDDGPTYDRTVSVIAYLNEDYVGGEIEFPGFGVFYKPRAGDVLLFPSSYIYIHNIKEITEGVRYAVVNWYSYLARLK